MSQSLQYDSARKTAWIDSVNQLCDDIEKWAHEADWDVLRKEKEVTESRIGTYTVPQLIVAYPGGRLYVNPVGTDIVGADGRVDLESYPTFNTMVLIRNNNDWKIYTDSRIPWPESWGAESFKKIVVSLQ